MNVLLLHMITKRFACILLLGMIAQNVLSQITPIPPTTRTQVPNPVTPPTSPTTQASPPSDEWAWKAIFLQQTAPFPHFKHTVKVAIIDDAFDLDNPLWAAHIAHNEKEIPGNSIDDDHNGKTDDYEGWDFGDNDEDVRPAPGLVEKESHGTKVLGVFWQTLRRLYGGDPPGITILPIKAVSDNKMNNYLKEGYNGIAYAITQRADIIICSWSGPFIAAEEKAILEQARAAGIMVIASAGNFYAMQPMYPGAIPSVICVAAIDRNGRKMHLSNYGNFVDISAPGDSLNTFYPYKKTANTTLSATSAATPVIGAIVTALRAACPELSPAGIERIIKNTATPLEETNPLYAGNLGAGMVNVAAISTAIAQGASSERTICRQPKAYIDLNNLTTDRPVKIVPSGRYKNFKFLLQTSPSGTTAAATSGSGLTSGPISSATARTTTKPTTLPDIRIQLFDQGQSTDTIIRKEKLKYPLLLTGDSIYMYRYSINSRAPYTRTGHTSETAAISRTAVISPAADIGHNNTWSATSSSSGSYAAAHPASAWYYYEVTTIDSSNLYCGGSVTNVTGTDGYIEDGSGDNNYTGRNDCKWQITVPEGKKIQFNFEQFDTEPKLDQVYIFNGNSTKDPILAIFSGHKIPPIVKSWGNTALIWFLTNEENNYQGWKLHYKAVD